MSGTVQSPARTSLAYGIGVALIAATPALAAWRVDDTISPLDGSRSYAALLQSSTTLRDAAGSNEPAAMVIRCTRGYLEAYIAWPRKLGTGPLEMRWSTDAAAPTQEVWSVSVDGSATFSEATRAFLSKIRSAHQASFQLSLANFDSLQASFDVTGADKIVDTALAACAGPRR